MLALLLAACAAPPTGPIVLSGAEIIGIGVSDVRIEDGRIVAVGEVDPTGATVLSHEGQFIVPAFVDAHVHLAYLERAPQMAAGGVGAVVDWASPVEWLDPPLTELQRVASGPMITATSGYPTTSWGRDGYGAECTDPASCVAQVEQLLSRGAGVIKLPITAGPTLDDASLTAVITAAHDRGLQVGTHAMSDADVARAGRLGIDILVHTPTEPLSAQTVSLWSGRAVISTLDAFGSSPAAIDNLRRLREAGTTVIYGTDFGNSRTPGIQLAELEALGAAGLDGAAILAAGTTIPAERFGFSLGIEVGKPASLLVLDADPRLDPGSLARPVRVLLGSDLNRTIQ